MYVFKFVYINIYTLFFLYIDLCFSNIRYIYISCPCLIVQISRKNNDLVEVRRAFDSDLAVVGVVGVVKCHLGSLNATRGRSMPPIGCGFKNVFFYFHPEAWENDPI